MLGGQYSRYGLKVNEDEVTVIFTLNKHRMLQSCVIVSLFRES